MRWFKHFTDNHRGRSMQFLLDEMGHMGPCCYYNLVEMCVEKMDQKSDRTLEEADCLFSFHQRVVRQNLRISPTNLRQLLDICQTFGLFTFQFSGNTLEISMPIILDLLEYDQKKSRARRAQIAPQSRLEKSRVEKNRTDQNREDVVAEKTAAAESSVKLFNDRFNPEYQKVLKMMGRSALGLSLKRHVGKILERFETCENFAQWVADAEERFKKSKTSLSQKGWLEIAIKSEIGVMNKKSATAPPAQNLDNSQ